MLLKSADNKDSDIAELERLIMVAPPDRRARIERELRTVRAGIKAEQEAAYLIDFYFQASKNSIVIHDLRVEANGRVAQMDHVLLHRTLAIFVLESKNFSAGMKVTEDGEFLRWNDYRKTFEGMPSPLAQNDRHILVLKDAFEQIEMPTRLGMCLSPSFESYVLVSANSRIDRPRRFDTTRVIKADMLRATIDTRFDKQGFLDTVGALSRVVSQETIAEIGRQLVALHRPFTIDYTAKFGLKVSPPERQVPMSQEPVPPAYVAPPPTAEPHKCRGCGGGNLSIQHGKYGYYFKCADCGGNIAIRIDCGNKGHRERIRKEGKNFFRECADCETSSLYFVNPA